MIAPSWSLHWQSRWENGATAALNVRCVIHTRDALTVFVIVRKSQPRAVPKKLVRIL